MQLLENKTTFSSLELVEQINIFRKEEREKEQNVISKNRLYEDIQHKSLLEVIREEFSEEISQHDLKPSEYEVRGKNYPMFILTLSQAKQILVKESKIVRKAMIAYIERLEYQLKPKELTRLELANYWRDAEIAKAEAEQKVQNLTIALDSSLEWCSIIKCATWNKVHESVFKWQILKKKSIELGYGIKKLPSTRYTYQNAYHVNVFRVCYPQYNYNFNNQLTLI